MQHIKTVRSSKVSKSAKSSSLLKNMFVATSYGETANGAKTFTRTQSSLLVFMLRQERCEERKKKL